MPALQLLPAVDVADGRAVQLVQGVAGSERVFGDPVEAALRWQQAGARWIHLVDLDAAFGRGGNRELLTEVVSAVDVDVELSGGIRDDGSLDAALSTGCRRVNIGTAALERPSWCAEVIAAHGERVAIGLDVRGTTLAARGWTRDGGNLHDTIERLNAAGCARYVVTDVNRDGMLEGPNLQLLRDVCSRTDAPVIASGRGLDARRPPCDRVVDRRRRRGGDHRDRPVHRRVRARGRTCRRRGGGGMSTAVAEAAA
jgi:phosphoribosyl isomerase A